MDKDIPIELQQRGITEVKHVPAPDSPAGVDVATIFMKMFGQELLDRVSKPSCPNSVTNTASSISDSK